MAPVYSGFDAAVVSPVFKDYFYEPMDQRSVRMHIYMVDDLWVGSCVVMVLSRVAVVVVVKVFGVQVDAENKNKLETGVVCCAENMLERLRCQYVRRSNITANLRNIAGKKYVLSRLLCILWFRKMLTGRWISCHIIWSINVFIM